jgi:hypothetical protein
MAIWYQQTIFNSSWEIATWQTHSFLSNVLLDNNNKSDMVEAIAYVLFSMH